MVGHVSGTDDYPQQAQEVLQSVLDLANRIDRGEVIDQALSRSTSLMLPGTSMPQLPARSNAAESE
ncbi:hypothetical protein, partial [Enterococcus faecalis]|uniref:hypothetical protein n=1 Tax=Enterococcus faecalis TaxID=1351 RepID=UPI003D6BF709